MIDQQTRQYLRELLAVHGNVKSIQILDADPGSPCLLLATMENAACAMSAQAALGLNSFGHNSLLINEHWLREHLGRS